MYVSKAEAFVLSSVSDSVKFGVVSCRGSHTIKLMVCHVTLFPQVQALITEQVAAAEQRMRNEEQQRLKEMQQTVEMLKSSQQAMERQLSQTYSREVEVGEALQHARLEMRSLQIAKENETQQRVEALASCQSISDRKFEQLEKRMERAKSHTEMQELTRLLFQQLKLERGVMQGIVVQGADGTPPPSEELISLSQVVQVQHSPTVVLYLAC